MLTQTCNQWQWRQQSQHKISSNQQTDQKGPSGQSLLATIPSAFGNQAHNDVYILVYLMLIHWNHDNSTPSSICRYSDLQHVEIAELLAMVRRHAFQYKQLPAVGVMSHIVSRTSSISIMKKQVLLRMISPFDQIVDINILGCEDLCQPGGG